MKHIQFIAEKQKMMAKNMSNISVVLLFTMVRHSAVYKFHFIRIMAQEGGDERAKLLYIDTISHRR